MHMYTSSRRSLIRSTALLPTILIALAGCAPPDGEDSRNDCFIDLKRTACLQGADTVYGLNESVAEGNTYVTATFARALVDGGAAAP